MYENFTLKFLLYAQRLGNDLKRQSQKPGDFIVTTDSTLKLKFEQE